MSLTASIPCPSVKIGMLQWLLHTARDWGASPYATASLDVSTLCWQKEGCACRRVGWMVQGGVLSCRPLLLTHGPLDCASLKSIIWSACAAGLNCLPTNSAKQLHTKALKRRHLLLKVTFRPGYGDVYTYVFPEVYGYESCS